MILDTTSKSVELVLGAAHATTAPVWGVEYVDHTSSAIALPASGDGVANGTTPVTIVAAPAASTSRQVLSVTVYNADTIAQTATVSLNNSSTLRTRHKATLQPGDVLTWTPGRGWAVLDSSGNVRTIATPAGSGAGVGDGAPVLGHAGGGGIDIWYAANVGNCTAYSTATITANVMRAMPFIAPRRGGTLDRLAINVTTLSAGAGRLGIYRATSETNVYPGSLVLDAGTVDTSATGVKPITISQSLVAGQLYWLACVFSATPVIRGFAVGSVSEMLGISAALGTAANAGISVAFTYAALPSTFTAGGAVITAVPIPGLFYRFSA